MIRKRFDFNESKPPILGWSTPVEGYAKLEFHGNYIYEQKDIEGEIKWKLINAKTGGDDGWVAQPPQENADLFIWIDNITDTVYAQTQKDRTLKWSRPMRQTIASSFGYVWDLITVEDIVYISGQGSAAFDSKGYVLALSKETGDVLWTYPTIGEVNKPVVIYNNFIYVADQEKNLHCLLTKPELALGKCVWTYQLLGPANHGASDAEIVCWGDNNDNLHCVSAKTGKLIWQFKAPRIAYASGPVFFKDWIFVGGSGYIYGLDRKNGALRWKHWLTEKNVPSPKTDLPTTYEIAIFEFQNCIYARSRQGILFCFSLP